MRTAELQDRELLRRMERGGIKAGLDDARTLRRAERTLRRWSEQECGGGNDHCSWAIERDDSTGKAYRCVYPHDGQSRRYPIADRERGALRRIAKVCKRLGCHFYHQGDPRGSALYVSAIPLDAQNYSTLGVCCAV